MKAYLHPFNRVINIPYDAKVMPLSYDNVKILYSESAKHWYVLNDIEQKRTSLDDDIYFYCFAHGSFLHCMSVYPYKLTFDMVPFCWGKPIKNGTVNNAQCLPLYTRTITEETDKNGEFVVRYSYKIVHICDHSMIEPDNIFQQNSFTSISEETFDNLIDLIVALEHYTKTTF